MAELISYLKEEGIDYFDWNVSSADAASSKPVPAETLINNMVNGAKKVKRGVVLMHDSEAKTTTVAALGPTIDKLREMGFAFKALTPEDVPVLYSYRN